MVLDENLVGLGAAALCDEPPGAFGQHEDKDNLHDGRDHLQQRGDSPAPVVGDAVCAKGDGGGNNLADEVGDVEEGCEDGTLLGVAKLSDERRARDDAGRDSEAEDDTGDNVHGNCMNSGC